MTVVVEAPAVDELGPALAALREWADDGAPYQLHPGDVGWTWRFGAEATAAAVRTWSRDGQLVAVGLLDEPDLLRLAIAPWSQRDGELAHRLADDLTEPARGVLPEGKVGLEAPQGSRLRELLSEAGWVPDLPWTPLRRDLAGPVPDSGLRIEVVAPEQVAVRVAVQVAAFDRSTFTVERWAAMAAGPPYADARCLVAHDDDGEAVAAATVWSAGPGRPGLIEPLGVHGDHRGQRHGRAITLAAAAALRELGSSSTLVCTPSSNHAAIATYVSAGFVAQPEVRDLSRGPVS